MTNFNYDNYDDDTKAKYDDGIEFLDDDFSFDEDDDDDAYYSCDDDFDDDDFDEEGFYLF